MFNIKKVLGLCECKKCFRVSMYELEIKGTEIKMNICDKHAESIAYNSTLKEFEFKDGTKIKIG